MINPHYVLLATGAVLTGVWIAGNRKNTMTLIVIITLTGMGLGIFDPTLTQLGLLTNTTTNETTTIAQPTYEAPKVVSTNPPTQNTNKQETITKLAILILGIIVAIIGYIAYLLHLKKKKEDKCKQKKMEH